MKQLNLNIEEYAIVADFDGTITLEDSNDLLALTCGDEENVKIEADFCAGLISGTEAMHRHYQAMRIGFREYFEFLDAHILIDPEFDTFLQQLRMRELPFFIVSGGYRQGIRRVLGEERMQDVGLFANDLLEEKGYLVPSAAMKDAVCTEPIGPCDNCKSVCIETIRRQTNKKILFIGDGWTDRCAARKADLLFAKEGCTLVEYCQTHDLPYVLYECFADLIRILGWGE